MLLRHYQACYLVLFLATLTSSIGCCWNRRNAYAYAPPYAPPVYPQPGLPSQPVPAQPVAYPTAPVQAPVTPGTIVPATPIGAAAPTAITPTSANVACPPACDPCMTTNGVTPVVYEGAVQTTPCVPVQ